MKQNVLVIGLGEIGQPIYDLIASVHNAFGIDTTKNINDNPEQVDIMHICYPFQVKPSFEEVTSNYIKKYNPKLTIINSTVPPGTTDKIHELTQAQIVHSPVRGIHRRMARDLRRYTKFVGSTHIENSELAAKHFQSLGLKTRIASSARTTELMKLLSTTYYGMLIGWAQEMERICKKFDCDYDEIMSFAEEINQFIGGRPIYQPGVIGGHCVISNAELLNSLYKSKFIDALLDSNEKKKVGA